MIKHIRLIILDLTFLFGSAIGLVVSIIRPFNRNNMWRTSLFFKTRFFELITGVRFEIKGLEHLKNTKPAVIISNHQSNVDAAFMSKVFQQKTVVIGKKELKWIPIFGQLFWLAGNILIDRSNRVQSVNALKEVANIMQKESVSLWIMPEGTRGKGKKRGLKPFKKGAFYTAINAQAPIIPVCVNEFIHADEWNSFKPITLKVNILPPVSVNGLSTQDIPTLLDHCHQIMKKEIKILS